MFRGINPDVEIVVHNYNITTVANYEHFVKQIKYVRSNKVSLYKSDLLVFTYTRLLYFI